MEWPINLMQRAPLQATRSCVFSIEKTWEVQLGCLRKSFEGFFGTYAILNLWKLCGKSSWWWGTCASYSSFVMASSSFRILRTSSKRAMFLLKGWKHAPKHPQWGCTSTLSSATSVWWTPLTLAFSGQAPLKPLVPGPPAHHHSGDRQEWGSANGSSWAFDGTRWAFGENVDHTVDGCFTVYTICRDIYLYCCFPAYCIHNKTTYLQTNKCVYSNISKLICTISSPFLKRGLGWVPWVWSENWFCYLRYRCHPRSTNLLVYLVLEKRKNIATIQTVIRIPHFQIQIQKPKTKVPRTPNLLEDMVVILCASTGGFDFGFEFQLWILSLGFGWVLCFWIPGHFWWWYLIRGLPTESTPYVFSSKTDKCKM